MSLGPQHADQMVSWWDARVAWWHAQQVVGKSPSPYTATIVNTLANRFEPTTLGLLSPKRRNNGMALMCNKLSALLSILNDQLRNNKIFAGATIRPATGHTQGGMCSQRAACQAGWENSTSEI